MKESKYAIKIICGYRKDQEFAINANEAHKAYYAFVNPDKRVVFSNGLALRGSEIQRIEPDHHTPMGWNPTHQLTSDDWNEINANGQAEKLKDIIFLAKEVARTATPKELAMPLVAFKADRLLELQGS